MTTPQQKAAATRLRNRQEYAESMRKQREERQKKIDETANTIAPVTYRKVADELIEVVTCEGIEFIPSTYGLGYRNNTLIPGKSVTIATPSYGREYYTVKLLEGVNSVCVDFRQFTKREDAFKFAANYMNGKYFVG